MFLTPQYIMGKNINLSCCRISSINSIAGGSDSLLVFCAKEKHSFWKPWIYQSGFLWGPAKSPGDLAIFSFPLFSQGVFSGNSESLEM